MPTGPQVLAKVVAALTKANPSPRVVQFRQVTQTGGNTRLGVGGTTTVTTSEISTQPAVEAVTSEDIGSSAGRVQPGDWRFTFAGDVEESDLRTKQILYGDEVLNIVDCQPYAFGGTIVGWSVIARTSQTRT